MTKRPNWQLGASCRGLDPALFFPVRGKVPTEARAVCASCPVRQDCLDDALWTPVHTGGRVNRGSTPMGSGSRSIPVMGVWAGTSERQRRAIRADLRRSA